MHRAYLCDQHPYQEAEHYQYPQISLYLSGLDLYWISDSIHFQITFKTVLGKTAVYVERGGHVHSWGNHGSWGSHPQLSLLCSALTLPSFQVMWVVGVGNDFVSLSSDNFQN